MIVRLESFRAFSQTSVRGLSPLITSGEQHRWLFARLKHSPFRRFYLDPEEVRARGDLYRERHIKPLPVARDQRNSCKLFSLWLTDIRDRFLAPNVFANLRLFRHAEILPCLVELSFNLPSVVLRV